jgi:IS30 family transposase
MPGVRLSLEEREEIALAIAWSRGLTGIARGVGRPVSSVAREVTRNGGRGRCRAVFAERATRRRACRPMHRRLAGVRALGRRSSGACGCGTRRKQHANRLRLEHPGEPHWWMSHETIYRALSGQGRGGLRAAGLCAAHRSDSPSP